MSLPMPVSVALWAVLIGVVVRNRWHGAGRGVGLVLIFILQLWMIHWVGAALKLIPWARQTGMHETATGFWLTTIGLIAFVIGSEAIEPRIRSMIRSPTRGAVPLRGGMAAFLIVFGLLSYQLLLPVVRFVPTMNAFASVGWFLAITGLVLMCWRAFQQGRRDHLIFWLMISALLPFLTVYPFAPGGFRVDDFSAALRASALTEVDIRNRLVEYIFGA